MSMKDHVQDAANRIGDGVNAAATFASKTVADLKDAINEGVHRGAADAQQARRDVESAEMTPAEKAKSIVSQANDSILAEGHAIRRDVRENT